MQRNLEKYNIDMAVATAYAESLEKHLHFVRVCGTKLGLPAAQLLAHDSSKWSFNEFPIYAHQFHGVQDNEKFMRAWLHHLHHNPHHHEHWRFHHDGSPLFTSLSDNYLLAELKKLDHSHVALGPVDADSDPLKVLQVMRTALRPGDNVVNAGVEAWREDFSRDSAPVILLFQFLQKGLAEGVVVTATGVPDDSRPVQETVASAAIDNSLPAPDADAASPALSTTVKRALIDLGFSSRPALIGVQPGPLSGFLMQFAESFDLSDSHFSRLSGAQAQVISLALDTLLRSTQDSGKDRWAIGLIPLDKCVLFFSRPRDGGAITHGIISYPVLLKLLTDTGYYNTNYHWQHWIFPDGFTLPNVTSEKGVMAMPWEYALEMIADWQGSSLAYTGSDDMTVWLSKNTRNIRLHTETRKLVMGELTRLGYDESLLQFPKFVGY